MPMHQQVKDRLAKAALAEISHLEWEILDEQQLAQLYELVDRLSEALQGDAMIHVLTRAMMEHLTIAPPSLLEKALVPREQVVLGLVTALFSHGNKSRWKQ
jgi:hypothetical protein